MEAVGPGPHEHSPRWGARLAEAIQPLSLRADRLGAMPLFEGFRWSELEEAAGLFEDLEIARGARLTVQGRRDSRLWLISEGEALVSADARPLRVIGPGEAAGVAGMLFSLASPETTIALGGMRAFAIGPDGFRKLAREARIRLRLTALAGDQLRSRRLARLR